MSIPPHDDRLRSAGLAAVSAISPDHEIQQALYQAAKANDTATVAQLLKDMFDMSPIPREDLPAHYATIDSVTPRMAHMSLLVLSLQVNATGLFRFLAEQKPEETRRIAEAILPVMGSLDFVRPLSDLGADPAFMAGALAAQAVASGNLDLVTFMAAKGVDFNSTEHMKAPRHPLAIAGDIANNDLRRKIMETLLKGGATWDALDDATRGIAQDAYNQSRQGDIAQAHLAQLKERSRGLKPPAL